MKSRLEEFDVFLQVRLLVLENLVHDMYLLPLWVSRLVGSLCLVGPWDSTVGFKSDLKFSQRGSKVFDTPTGTLRR